MRKILFMLFLLVEFISCIPNTKITLQSNQEADFYMKIKDPEIYDSEIIFTSDKNEIFLGRGKIISFYLKRSHFNNQNEGKITLIARKDGYTDAITVIQPNIQNYYGSLIFMIYQPITGLVFTCWDNIIGINWYYLDTDVNLEFDN